MSRLDAIIFDCDGVMFESRQANLAYYNRILEEFSYPLVTCEQSENAHLCHTASSPVVLAELLRQDDLVPALEFADSLNYTEFIPHMEQEDNLTDLLDSLVGHYQLAIATNRGHSIFTILEHFGLSDYFSVVVSRVEVENPKPAPDMLLLAAELLKVDTDRCHFIGDSELDKYAATAAKVSFVGYGGAVAGDISSLSHLELLDYFAL